VINAPGTVARPPAPTKTPTPNRPQQTRRPAPAAQRTQRRTEERTGERHRMFLRMPETSARDSAEGKGAPAIRAGTQGRWRDRQARRSVTFT